MPATRRKWTAAAALLWVLPAAGASGTAPAGSGPPPEVGTAVRLVGEAVDHLEAGRRGRASIALQGWAKAARPAREALMRVQPSALLLNRVDDAASALQSALGSPGGRPPLRQANLVAKAYWQACAGVVEAGRADLALLGASLREARDAAREGEWLLARRALAEAQQFWLRVRRSAPSSRAQLLVTFQDRYGAFDAGVRRRDPGAAGAPFRALWAAYVSVRGA